MTGYSVRFIVALFILMFMAGCSLAPQQQGEGRYGSQAGGKHQREAIYFVRSGDTLTAIGRRFGVTSAQIQSRNGIADPHNLKIGTRLVIPYNNQQMLDSLIGKGQFIWPLEHLDVTSEFGSRNNRHKGIDLRAPGGTPIYASADGVVHFAGRKSDYGLVIILKHANNIQTFYAHNEQNLVRNGQRVKQGERIATVGRTGNATGHHVHFEFIRGRQPMNPRHYVSG